MKKRAIRRHHAERLKAKARRRIERGQRFTNIGYKPTAKEVGRDYQVHGAKCSGRLCCGNPRRYLKDKLTTPQLISYIHEEELRGTEGLNTLKVEKYRRTATPFTVLLLTIIGAVIASRKIRGGSGLHLAIGIAIAAIFIISDRFSTVFAVKSSLPPLIAAWLPNIAFSFVAYYFYKKAPK